MRRLLVKISDYLALQNRAEGDEKAGVLYDELQKEYFDAELESRKILPIKNRTTKEELKEMFMDIDAPLEIQLYFISLHKALEVAELEVINSNKAFDDLNEKFANLYIENVELKKKFSTDADKRYNKAKTYLQQNHSAQVGNTRNEIDNALKIAAYGTE